MARTTAVFGYISPQTVRVFLQGDTVDRYLSHLISGSQIIVQLDALTDGQPHTYVLEVTESGKPALTDTFSLTCQPASGGVTSAAISGPDTAGAGKTVTYSVASNGSEPKTYQWTVTGGTIIGSPSGSSIQVQWPNVGPGSVAVTVSGSQDSKASASKAVTVEQVACSCTLLISAVGKKTGTPNVYQAILNSPNANINPFDWVVKDANGLTVASGKTTPSSSPIGEFTMPAGLVSGTYSVTFASIPCTCVSEPYPFTHTSTNLPTCPEGPELQSVTVMALDKLQFTFHGSDIGALNWFVEQGTTTVYEGNTGPLTSASVIVNLPAPLAEGNYTFRIDASTCIGQTGVTLSVPFTITGGGGGCECTVSISSATQIGQTGTIAVTATSPDHALSPFDFQLLNSNGQVIDTGTFNPIES